MTRFLLSLLEPTWYSFNPIHSMHEEDFNRDCNGTVAGKADLLSYRKHKTAKAFELKVISWKCFCVESFFSKLFGCFERIWHFAKWLWYLKSCEDIDVQNTWHVVFRFKGLFSSDVHHVLLLISMHRSLSENWKKFGLLKEMQRFIKLGIMWS